MSNNTGTQWANHGYPLTPEESYSRESSLPFTPNLQTQVAPSPPQAIDASRVVSHTYSQQPTQSMYQMPLHNNELPHLRSHARERNSHELDHGHVHNHGHSPQLHSHSHNHRHEHGHNGKHKICVSEIMQSLDQDQKKVFLYSLVTFTIGIIIWVYGHAAENLSTIGFSYFLLFDSFNLLTRFISLLFTNHRTLAYLQSSRYPYGLHRIVVLLGLTNSIFLIFAGMYSIKEGFEHILLGEGHHNPDSSYSKYILIPAALLIVVVSKLNLEGNGRPWAVQQLKDPFNTIALLSALAILLIDPVASNRSQATFLDQLITILESIGMFYIGFPEAVQFSKIILQTTPQEKLPSIEQRISEINSLPQVLGCKNIHFWSPTKTTLIGSLEVYVGPQVNEQLVLEQVHRITAGLVNELTVQVVKSSIE